MMLKGKLKFPGDKSISHRALILAALTNSDCQIENISTGADVESTRNCLALCGINSNRIEESVSLKGGQLRNSETNLDCGNSGTTARLLIGLLAGQKVRARFVGDESLSRRPMQRIIHPLEKMGAKFESSDQHFPLTLSTTHLTGISYTPSVASAQVKSAILLSGLGAEGETTVTELKPTRNHTELMLNELGADIRTKDNSVTVLPLQRPLNSFEITIPGDPSTAAFFAAAAVLIPNSDLILENVSANPTRTGFYAVLEQMCGNIECLSQWEDNGERAGNLRIRGSQLQGISITKDDIPGMIDEIPILAVMATQAEGTTEIRGATELRVKECDRINAICINLKRMGADITEFDDGFAITGPTTLKSAKIKTFGDHRIAMAFTIAGLAANVPVKLDNPDCVNISFPEFYSFLRKVS
jgi:3-phosphoshikimate 1-carboxyvinyltransferase